MVDSSGKAPALFRRREAHASHCQEHSLSEAAVKGDRREPRQRACPLTRVRAKGTRLLHQLFEQLVRGDFQRTSRAAMASGVGFKPTAREETSLEVSLR